MNLKIVGLAFLVGGAVVAGCAQLKLMSNDPQVRVAAVSELRLNELEQVLYTPTYSEDVIDAAAKRVYESYQEQALSYYEKCEYKNPTAAAKLANCFNNPKGWEHLFERYSYQNNVAGRILYSFVNSKTGTFVSGKLGANYAKTGSEVGGGELLVWAVKNVDKRGVSRFFGDEEKIIEKMSDTKYLMMVAEDTAISAKVRQAAACKLLKDKSIKSDAILKTVNLFNPKDEEVFSDVAAEGLVAARRIGDEDLVNAIKGKAKPCIDETLARGKARSAKLVSVDGFYIGMERWRAALLARYDKCNGIRVDGENGKVTSISFTSDYVDARKDITETEYEKWIARFLCGVGIGKSAKVLKDEDGQISIVDRDSLITFLRKGGAVDGIKLESDSAKRQKAKEDAAMASFFMSQLQNALQQDMNNQMQGQMIQPQQTAQPQPMNNTEQSVSAQVPQSMQIATPKVVCRYCGQAVPAGHGCSSSPTGKHVLNYSDGKHCIYCGADAPAGHSCSDSPTKKHVHGSDGVHCIYCGQNAPAGRPCYESPTKSHVL